MSLHFGTFQSSFYFVVTRDDNSSNHNQNTTENNLNEHSLFMGPENTTPDSLLISDNKQTTKNDGVLNQVTQYSGNSAPISARFDIPVIGSNLLTTKPNNKDKNNLDFLQQEDCAKKEKSCFYPDSINDQMTFIQLIDKIYSKSDAQNPFVNELKLDEDQEQQDLTTSNIENEALSRFTDKKWVPNNTDIIDISPFNKTNNEQNMLSFIDSAMNHQQFADQLNSKMRKPKIGTKHHKKGAGKKIVNQNVEDIIFGWFEESQEMNQTPTRRQILQKGRELKHATFKASKGWVDKMIMRLESHFSINIGRQNIKRRKFNASLGELL